MTDRYNDCKIIKNHNGDYRVNLYVQGTHLETYSDIGLLDKMNSLTRENKQLKLKIGTLEEANKTIQATSKELFDVGNYQTNRIRELIEDNKRLRQLLYKAHEDVIYEYSGNIQKDIDEWGNAIENGSIDDIEECMRG